MAPPSGALFLLKRRERSSGVFGLLNATRTPPVRGTSVKLSTRCSKLAGKVTDALVFWREVQNKMRAKLTIDLIAEPIKDREDSVSEKTATNVVVVNQAQN